MLATLPEALAYASMRRRSVRATGASATDGYASCFTLAGPGRFPACFVDGGHKTCFSSATLAEMELAGVFDQKGWPHRRGVLFESCNGGQRALGGCRLGVDPRRKFVGPRFMRMFGMRVGLGERRRRSVVVGFSDRYKFEGEEE